MARWHSFALSNDVLPDSLLPLLKSASSIRHLSLNPHAIDAEPALQFPDGPHLYWAETWSVPLPWDSPRHSRPNNLILRSIPSPTIHQLCCILLSSPNLERFIMRDCSGETLVESDERVAEASILLLHLVTLFLYDIPTPVLNHLHSHIDAPTCTTFEASGTFDVQYIFPHIHPIIKSAGLICLAYTWPSYNFAMGTSADYDTPDDLQNLEDLPFEGVDVPGVSIWGTMSNSPPSRPVLAAFLQDCRAQFGLQVIIRFDHELNLPSPVPVPAAGAPLRDTLCRAQAITTLSLGFATEHVTIVNFLSTTHW